MALTPQQALALKTDIEADPAFAAIPHNADGAYAIADAYSAIPSPAWIVWKTSVTADSIMQNGFDWARVDNLSVGKARIWQWMFENESRSINPSKINVRAGIDATWVGTAADLAVRAAVYAHCKRSANRIEKLLSTGTGSDASPAAMGFEGSLTYGDVLAAMGW
jgi:hypothetical protein